MLCPSRLCALRLLAALPLALLLAGCYQDKQGYADASVDANGDLHKKGGTTVVEMNKTAKTPAEAKKDLSPDTPTEADFGLPFYPGAKPHTDLDDKAKASKSAEDIRMLLLETDDPEDKVGAFYKERIKGPQATLTDKPEDGKRVQSFSEPWGENGLHSVEVYQEGGKTLILLMHIPSLKIKSSAPPG